jgi:transcriptional regulator with XRE-family HTH domain
MFYWSNLEMGKKSHRIIRPTTELFVCRALKGLNQTEVGAKTGVGQSFVSQLETTQISAAVYLQERFAKLYGKDVDVLFDERGFAKVRN